MIKEKFTLIADGYKYFHDGMYPGYVENITSTTYIRNPKMDLTYTNGHVCVFGLSLIFQRLENMLRDFVETFSYNDVSNFIYMPDNMKLNFSKLYLFLKDKEKSDSLLLELLDINFIHDGSFLIPGERVLTIRNKQREFRWLPNYLETFINSELWKGTYIATQAASYLGAICNGIKDSNISRDEFLHIINKGRVFHDYEYTIHDFSARGMSGIYDTIFHNVAHLLFFKGTDSIAIDHLRLNGFYKDLKIESLIPASEHSVMCSYGKNNELNSIIYLMEKFNKQPLSLVCDSYDIFELLNYLSVDDKFLNLLSNRDINCPLVIRGDSGDPVKIMTGNSEISTKSGEKRDELESLGLVKSLSNLFGDYFEFGVIKAIYGDAITPQKTYEIFRNLYNDGVKFLNEHIVLGAGSFTYNYATRDSVGLVTKATSYTDKNGSEIEIVKNPITDTKKSSLKIKDNVLIPLSEEGIENLKYFSISKANAREEFDEKIISSIIGE